MCLKTVEGVQEVSSFLRILSSLCDKHFMNEELVEPGEEEGNSIKDRDKENATIVGIFLHQWRHLHLNLGEIKGGKNKIRGKKCKECWQSIQKLPVFVLRSG